MKKIYFKDTFLPNPCPAEWDEMIPKGKDRFCNGCSRMVYDFTEMSEDELTDFIKKNGIQCGKFAEHQLNQSLRFSEKEKRQFSPKKWFKASLAILMIKIPLFSYSQDTTKINKNTFGNSIELNIEGLKKDPLLNSKNKYIIRGHVELKYNVKINLYDSNKKLICQTTPDTTGSFKITLNKKITSRDVFYISASKPTIKRARSKNIFEFEEKEIYLKDFGHVEINYNQIYKRRPSLRRSWIGCPKFRK